MPTPPLITGRMARAVFLGIPIIAFVVFVFLRYFYSAK
jgi:hypothetical protein